MLVKREIFVLVISIKSEFIFAQTNRFDRLFNVVQIEMLNIYRTLHFPRKLCEVFNEWKC